MGIEIVVEEARWSGLGLAALAERAFGAALGHLGHDAAVCEAGLLACDDARIAVLNAGFRGKPQATNVLSWPADDLASGSDGGNPLDPEPDPDGTIALGDIAIAYETCAREAQAACKPLADHATHLVVHGVLHLLGYDHVRDADATLMEAAEVTILGKLGLQNPYDIQD